MKARYLLAPLLMSAAAGSANAATCTLGEISAPNLIRTYDPFDATFQSTPQPVFLPTKGDCGSARIRITLAPTPSNPETGTKVLLRYGGTTLPVTIKINNRPSPIVPVNGGFAANPLLLAAGSAGEVSLDLETDAGQVVTPGLYQAQVLLQAEMSANGDSVMHSVPVTVAVRVKPSVRLAVGAGDLSIDLGELKAGAVGGPVNFDAYSNVGYILSIRSDNGFRLTRGHSDRQGVPYQAVLREAAMQSEQGVGGALTKQAGFSAPGLGIRHHVLRVRVDPFPNLPAGQYQDVLTVQISARV